MGEKCKHLCKWEGKLSDKRLKKLMKIVQKPSFVCRRCGRAADSAKWLCKPAALDCC